MYDTDVFRNEKTHINGKLPPFKKMFAIKTMGPIKRLLSKMQESFLQKVPKKCWKKCTM